MFVGRRWVSLLSVALAAILLLVQSAESLRGGAPALACRSLRPFHGLHRPKPASASQFFVTQSTMDFAPNETVTVEIATHSDERFFRGFLVQAYDPANGERFGKFLPSEHSQPVWCSAATHRDHKDKRYIELKWVESTDPEHFREDRPRRQVRFRATIVVTYSEFYTNFQSSDRNFERLNPKSLEA